MDRFTEGLLAGFSIAQTHAELVTEYNADPRGKPNTGIDWVKANEELDRRIKNEPPPPMRTFADLDAAARASRFSRKVPFNNGQRTAYAVLTARDEGITGVGVFGEATPTGRITADCTSVVLFERTGKDYVEAQQAAFEELKNARWSWTGVLSSDGLGRYYRDARGFTLTRLPDPHAEAHTPTGDDESALAQGLVNVTNLVREYLDARGALRGCGYSRGCQTHAACKRLDAARNALEAYVTK